MGCTLESRNISRGVTSCAGMTTHHVLLAQKKIGFSEEVRSNRFRQLEEGEQDAEKEKAFARLLLPLHVPGYEKTYWSRHSRRVFAAWSWHM